jgi:hypothetical protein
MATTIYALQRFRSEATGMKKISPAFNKVRCHQEHSHLNHHLCSAAGQERSDRIEENLASVQQGLRPSTRRSPLHQEHSHLNHDLRSAAGQERSDRIEDKNAPAEAGALSNQTCLASRR